MPGSRRFALIAALVLLAGLALGGCGRGRPGVAAYVGGQQYSEQHVRDIIDDARSNNAVERLGDARREVVSWLVLAELGRLAAGERGIAVPPTDSAAAAAELQVDPKLTVVRVFGDWATVRDALAASVPPVTPTDSDLREIYEFLRATNQVPPNATYEQIAQQLRASTRLPTVVGVRNALRDAAGDANLLVNPRYRPLAASVFGLPMVLAESSGAVTDRSSG